MLVRLIQWLYENRNNKIVESLKNHNFPLSLTTGMAAVAVAADSCFLIRWLTQKMINSVDNGR